tara:strand:- start:3718 stop:4095 length:378 start_codon:yes stop_codon:yes gene_type:complete
MSDIENQLDLSNIKDMDEIESTMETKIIKEKDIVILRFNEAYPLPEESLYSMMNTIRRVINKDITIANRFICLADGLNIETMGESEFIQIWKNKYGDESFEKANAELNNENPNQMNLFKEEAIDE